MKAFFSKHRTYHKSVQCFVYVPKVLLINALQKVDCWVKTQNCEYDRFISKFRRIQNPVQHLKIELFAKRVNSVEPLSYVAKNSIPDV